MMTVYKMKNTQIIIIPARPALWLESLCMQLIKSDSENAVLQIAFHARHSSNFLRLPDC